MVYASFADGLRALMAERGIGVRPLARMIPCDPGHLSHMRSGRDTPSSELARRFDEILGADGTLAATVRPRTPATAPQRAGAVRPDETLDPSTVPTPVSRASTPSAVGAADVKVIRGMLDALIASDRQFGGLAREYATGYLSNVVLPRLDAHGKEPVLGRLFAVSAEFALRVAAMNLDAGEVRASHKYLGTASSIAHQTDDLSLGAWVLARCGEQEIHEALLARWQGDRQAYERRLDRALAYTDGAAAMARSATPAARAFVLTKRALAASMTGDRSGALRVLGEVWDSYDGVGYGEEPEWMRVYGWGHLRHEEARCYYNLGMGDRAAKAAEDSISARADLRPRAFSLGVQAIGHAQAGEVEAACTVAHELVGLAAQLTSSRVTVRLTEVLGSLRPYRSVTAVQDLYEVAGPVLGDPVV